MTPPPTHQKIASVLSIIKELSSSINVPLDELSLPAPVAAEGILANRSGIDPEVDLVSIQGAWLHAHLTLQAAREHLGAGLCLLGLDAGRTTMNPVQALGSYCDGGMRGVAMAMQQHDHLGRTPTETQPTPPQSDRHFLESDGDRST